MAGERQEKVADEATLVLLKRFSRNPDVEKARAEFDRAQKVEEQFHKDFDGVQLLKILIDDMLKSLLQDADEWTSTIPQLFRSRRKS